MSGSQFLPKLSSKTMKIEPDMVQGKDGAGRPKMLAADTPENKRLYRIVGIAGGIKSGVSAFGEWAAFIGNFTATVAKTGEVFQSGKAFLPPIVSNLVQGQLVAGASNVEFAYDVGVIPSDRSAQGYEWIATPLIEATAASPLDNLVAKIKADPLPTPKAPENKDGDTGNEKGETEAPAATKKTGAKK